MSLVAIHDASTFTKVLILVVEAETRLNPDLLRRRDS